MKISFGFGWLLTPLRYRRYRRIGAGALFIMGAFSFVTFDLAPRDGHMVFAAATTPGEHASLVLFYNSGQHDVRDLHASFATYDFDGKQIAADTFAPKGMTVVVDGKKTAELGSELFPKDETAFLYFCGSFRGSYFFDRLKEERVIVRGQVEPDGMTFFSDTFYNRSRHFLTRPDCASPEDLTVHSQANDWEIKSFFEGFERAGMGTSPDT